jgi:type I restriction enzyme S subunit
MSRSVPPNARIVTAYTNGDVTFRENRRIDGYHEAADLSSYQGVRAGDFVVHGLDILRGSVGVSDSSGAISAVCTVCVPRVELDPRFFAYAMRAQAFTGFPRVMARGIREGGADFRRWETLGDLPLPVPPAGTQRQVADYIDAESARVDRLAEARVTQLRLLDERQESFLSALLVPVDIATVRLRFLAVLQAGLTVDAQRDAGPDAVVRPYLRVANVQPGWLELDSVTEIAVPRLLAERCTLRPGDVLMTEGGDLDKLGRGTMWRGELPGALHQNHIFALRPDPSELIPDYLTLLTQTSHARAYFERTGSRTTNLASTNSEKIMSLPIPRLSLAEQGSLVEKARRGLNEMAALQSGLRCQIELLAERRQALITAAVTGQIEIPGVAA